MAPLTSIQINQPTNDKLGNNNLCNANGIQAAR